MTIVKSPRLLTVCGIFRLINIVRDLCHFLCEIQIKCTMPMVCNL